MADIVITGTGVRAYQTAAGADQYVREARANAKGALPNIPWTVTTAGLSNVIAADLSRVGLLIVSNANGIVYLRFDATIPVPATPAYDWLLNPGDRWEVPQAWCQLAVSMAGSVAGGQILAASGTAA